MATYGWSLQFCRTGISSAKSQVFYNAAREREGDAFSGPVWKRVSDGYVRQEYLRLRAARKRDGEQRRSKR